MSRISKALLQSIGIEPKNLWKIMGVHRSVGGRVSRGESKASGSLLALLYVWPKIPKRMQRDIIEGKHLQLVPGDGQDAVDLGEEDAEGSDD